MAKKMPKPSSPPKKREEKKEETKHESNSTPGLLWLILIAISLILIVWPMASKYKREATKPKPPKPAVVHWYLSWEDPTGERLGKSFPINMQRKDDLIVFTYEVCGGGITEGKKIGENTYKGVWREERRGSWGKFELTFETPDKASGWWDDKGKGVRYTTLVYTIAR